MVAVTVRAPLNRKEDLAPAPRVVSSGFATIDIRVDNQLLASPGGTAVNVARALSNLGWTSSFVGTVGTDPAGSLLKSTLAEASVDVEHLWQDSAWLTPILVQTSEHGDHGWRFSCPVCGARYAKHRPSPESKAKDLLEKVATPDVFFFDRTSLFTLALAETWSKSGAVVIFEPSGRGREQLFQRALKSATIVKYSEDRSAAFEALLESSSAALVKTVGSRGSMVRGPSQRDWTTIDSIDVDNLIDSAGAGDWTTAGMLDALIATSATTRARDLKVDLVEALPNGHRLGAAACGWRGVFPTVAATLRREDLEEFGCPRLLKPTSSSLSGLEQPAPEAARK